MLALDKSFRDEINVAIAINQYQYFVSEGCPQDARKVLDIFCSAYPELANHPRLVAIMSEGA
jgi:hypothetical protein